MSSLKRHHLPNRLNSQIRHICILIFSCLTVTALFAEPAADPRAALAEADRLAWLKNWTKAEPFFAKAEAGFTAIGDRRNALYAKVGRLRGELRSSSPLIISHEVALLLNDPLVEADKALRLRCLTVKGDADLDIDSNLAQRDWKEALSLSKELGVPDWESRAKGELGIIAFLHGDTGGAMLQVGLALRYAVTAHDLGAEIRYRTLAGQGMSELGKGDEALTQFDKAMALATNNKDLGMPLLALSGKATALVKLNRATEARTLLNQALSVARNDGSLGYQADLLTQLGLLESKAGDRAKAVSDLEKAARLSTTTKGYRLAAQADHELAKLYHTSGDTANQRRVLITGIAASRQAGDRYFQPDPKTNEDGFLQAREISRLPLRADLVTLSACETGSGKINGQEGVENLARPFLFAGAKSVLANLWDVDDEFSRGLMKRFYSNLAAGQEKAAALNSAKLSMIHDYGDQAPAALWSGFLLFGDGAGRVFGSKEAAGD